MKNALSVPVAEESAVVLFVAARSVTVPTTEKLSPETIREISILLLAVDSMLCWDFTDADKAVAWSRRLVENIDVNPMWANGRHQGDCTHDIHTCSRCLVEKFEAQARQMEEDG